MSGERSFAVWITGIPASGKSSITRELVARLDREGLRPAILESDAMRAILTPEPTFSQAERDRFYRHLVDIGELLFRQDIPVIFDATANRREYRDLARSRMVRFVEVFVSCPVDICRRRDPKGIYAAAVRGTASSVPGLQAEYEPPLSPELIVDCQESPAINAAKIIVLLKELSYI